MRVRCRRLLLCSSFEGVSQKLLAETNWVNLLIEIEFPMAVPPRVSTPLIHVASMVVISMQLNSRYCTAISVLFASTCKIGLQSANSCSAKFDPLCVLF